MDRVVPDMLRLARERRRVTQRQMATRLDVGQQQVAKIEHPGKAPLVPALLIARWARALGTTVEEMAAEHDAAAMSRALPRADPPAEPFAPPGPEREEQLRRLLVVCGGNAAQVARVVSKSPQRIRQVVAALGLAR